MAIIYVLLFLVVQAASYESTEEEVWLEDLNIDPLLRNLETPLYQELDFNLRRQSGTVLNLRLLENRRLNANAPVYETVLENGRQRAVRKESQPIEGTKFYHDKRYGAAVRVSCANPTFESCQRVLDGSLVIDGDSYEIQPSPTDVLTRGVGRMRDIAHILRKVEPPPPQSEKERKLGLFGTDSKRIQETLGASMHDHVIVPGEKLQALRNVHDEITVSPGQKFHGFRETPDGKSAPTPEADDERKDDLINILRSLLLDRELDSTRTAPFRHGNRHRRQAATEYAVEVLMVIDPALWKRYYNTRTIAGMSADEATEYILREKLAHIMNGVSIRYESIDDPLMNVYVTISGFLFYKEISESNPLSPSHSIITSNGTDYADSDVYIDNLDEWALTLTGLPHNDHIMVITGYELYYGGDIQNDGVAGVAYVRNACDERYRVSVQEDGGYFFLTSVAAHELGHNLGADHDGSGSSASCVSDEQYMMAPYIASFRPEDTYNMNPWHFSDCSVKAFISYFRTVSCLTDHGDYYDPEEWKQHNAKLPGELYSLQEQCDLIYSASSELCFTSDSEENFCQAIGCRDPRNGLCYYHVPARGSPCGDPSQNKWCLNGKCEVRAATTPNPTTSTPSSATTTSTTTSTTPTTTTPTTTTTTTTTPSTTTPTTTTPTTTTPSSTSTGSCLDIGWYNWSCRRVSKFFYDKYRYRPSYWCQDPYWANACCVFCRAEGCVDEGYKSMSCPSLSQYLKRKYGLVPEEWCTYPKLKQKCCEYCHEHGV